MAKTKRPSSLLVRLGWKLAVLAVVIAGGAAVALASIIFGHVSGEEFSPHTFSRRQFSFREIPLLGIPVTGVHYTDVTSDLEKDIAAQGWAPIDTQPSRWDLIRGFRGMRRLGPGDAAILIHYLESRTAPGGDMWVEWSANHADRAAELWAAIAQVARLRLYYLTPEVLSLAHSNAPAEELGAELDRLLAERFCELAAAQHALGRHEGAVELYDAALACRDDYTAALRGRAEAHTALGHSAEAAADLAALQRVTAEKPQ